MFIKIYNMYPQISDWITQKRHVILGRTGRERIFINIKIIISYHYEDKKQTFVKRYGVTEVNRNF